MFCQEVPVFNGHLGLKPLKIEWMQPTWTQTSFMKCCIPQQERVMLHLVYCCKPKLIEGWSCATVILTEWGLLKYNCDEIWHKAGENGFVSLAASDLKQGTEQCHSHTEGWAMILNQVKDQNCLQWQIEKITLQCLIVSMYCKIRNVKGKYCMM